MIEFDLHILHLLPINLWSVNLYNPETHIERAMRTRLPEGEIRKRGGERGAGKVDFIRGVLSER